MTPRKTPQQFWDEVEAHDTGTGYGIREWWDIYRNAFPPGVLAEVINDPMDAIGVKVIERYCHLAAIGGAAQLMAYVSGIAGWTPAVVANDPLVLTSTAAGDTVAGAGAQVVRVDWIDENGVEQFANVNMNGLGNSAVFVTVPAVPGCFAINDIRVIQSGTPPVPNVGDITVEDNTNARVYEAIQAGMGKIQTCRYHIPANRKAFVIRLEMAAEVSDVTYSLFSSNDWRVPVGQIIERQTFCALPESAKWEHIFSEPRMVPPSIAATYPSVFTLECISANPVAEGTASVFFVLVDDT